MADLTITAADVERAGGRPEEGVTGEASLAVGKSVYKSLSDHRWYLALNGGTAAQSGAGTLVLWYCWTLLRRANNSWTLPWDTRKAAALRDQKLMLIR